VKLKGEKYILLPFKGVPDRRIAPIRRDLLVPNVTPNSKKEDRFLTGRHLRRDIAADRGLHRMAGPWGEGGTLECEKGGAFSLATRAPEEIGFELPEEDPT